VKTRAGLDAIVGDVEHEHPSDMSRHEGRVHHPIHETVEEAAHLRRVADEGKSPATPAIVVGVVLAFLAPFVAIVIFLVFTIAHFA
jgi:hypothetical protein